jgi:hypothetical protein
MSTRTVTYLTDDLTGEEGDDVETVMIGWKGKWAEVDLAKDNREDAEDYIGKLMAAGRTVKSDAAAKVRRAPGGGAGRDREQSKAIRDRWNEAHPDNQVSERGRIPQHVVDWYDAA